MASGIKFTAAFAPCAGRDRLQSPLRSFVNGADGNSPELLLRLPRSGMRHSTHPLRDRRLPCSRIALWVWR